MAWTTSPGGSTTTASYTTANNNTAIGWLAGFGGSSGKDVLNLEFCTGSENDTDGLYGGSANAQSVARYSNCVFANNGAFGVYHNFSGTFESRGNNAITGNGLGAAVRRHRHVHADVAASGKELVGRVGLEGIRKREIP